MARDAPPKAPTAAAAAVTPTLGLARDGGEVGARFEALIHAAAP
ncbi:hypothetical protein ACP70R_032955 [Stipagrostis hirtigluma subsp. patula]